MTISFSPYCTGNGKHDYMMAYRIDIYRFFEMIASLCFILGYNTPIK